MFKKIQNIIFFQYPLNGFLSFCISLIFFFFWDHDRFECVSVAVCVWEPENQFCKLIHWAALAEWPWQDLWATRQMCTCYLLLGLSRRYFRHHRRCWFARVSRGGASASRRGWQPRWAPADSGKQPAPDKQTRSKMRYHRAAGVTTINIGLKNDRHGTQFRVSDPDPHGSACFCPARIRIRAKR